ncbi:MAG: DUF5359 family protein [Bacillaceae bacterium]|nr:DUF5359 family protein [Bacillaceae bacterium]
MKKIEDTLKKLIILYAFLLIFSQWMVLHTDVEQYMNPVYEYLGVLKSLKL